MTATQKSGIGEYPSTRNVDRVDSVFEIQQGKQVSKKNRVGGNQHPFLRTKNVFWNRLDIEELDQMNFTEAEENRLKMKAGDVLLCEGGDIGRAAMWRGEIEDCYHQNHLHRLRALNGRVDPQYSVYWFWYAFNIANLYFGRGNVTTIPNLSRSKLAELPMALPTVTEQKKISHILSTVQRAIETQERIIQTTTELKKALMQKLFTEGLRGEPQKQTEIGLIPESWMINTVGEIAELKSGGTPSRKNSEYWDGGNIPWAKTGEVNYCIINDTEEKITEAGLKEYSAKLFPEGTLLMAMYGQGITRGKVALLGIKACTNQACVAFFKNQDIYSKYLYYYFEYNYDDIRNFAHGANQKNLSADIIKTFPVAYPKDKKEQIKITDALEQLDKKNRVHNKEKKAYQDLFRILLHELMTAKTRLV